MHIARHASGRHSLWPCPSAAHGHRGATSAWLQGVAISVPKWMIKTRLTLPQFKLALWIRTLSGLFCVGPIIPSSPASATIPGRPPTAIPTSLLGSSLRKSPRRGSEPAPGLPHSSAASGSPVATNPQAYHLKFWLERGFGVARAPSPDVRLGHPWPRLSPRRLRFRPPGFADRRGRLSEHGRPLAMTFGGEE